MSTAYMEAAVSKLLEAQAEKICTVAENDFTNQQMIAFNESTRTNINSLIRLHLLLSIKFELLINSMTIEDKETETEWIDKNEYREPNKKEKPEPPVVCEPTTYIFRGRGQGEVSNCGDLYADGLAIFQAYVSDAQYAKKELFLSYSAMKGTKMLVMLSIPKELHTQIVVKPYYKEIRVEGSGMIIIKERSKPDIRKTCKYVFDIRAGNCDEEPVTFEIDIKSDCNKIFNHNSGKIKSQASRVSLEPVNSLI